MYPNITTSNVIVSMSLFLQQQQLKGIILSKYPSKFRVIFDGFLSNLLFDPYVFFLHFCSQSLFSLSFFCSSLLHLLFDSYSIFWFPCPLSLFSRCTLLPDDSLSKPNPDPTLAPRCMPAVVKTVGYLVRFFGLNLGSSTC